VLKLDILKIKEAVQNTAIELCEKAKLKPGHTVIVGCSTSEIIGSRIGTDSNIEVGSAVFNELNSIFSGRGIILAAQCCEHLNRAIIVEQKNSVGFTVVNVVPTPKAGGAFATAAYEGFSDPVALESFEADAGLDIGGTLIGMHLKHVAVPLHLDAKHIGKAAIIAARTRPPLIGGSRASYDENIM